MPTRLRSLTADQMERPFYGAAGLGLALFAGSLIPGFGVLVYGVMGLFLLMGVAVLAVALNSCLSRPDPAPPSAGDASGGAVERFGAVIFPPLPDVLPPGETVPATQAKALTEATPAKETPLPAPQPAPVLTGRFKPLHPIEPLRVPERTDSKPVTPVSDPGPTPAPGSTVPMFSVHIPVPAPPAPESSRPEPAAGPDRLTPPGGSRAPLRLSKAA